MGKYGEIGVFTNTKQNKKSIQGLHVKYNAITEDEEKQLINEIDNEIWNTTLQRKTQQYGYIYDFKKVLPLQKTNELPSWAIDLCKKFESKGLINAIPNQLIVNEYVKDQCISAHTDSKMFGDVIFSVSLGGQCLMIFKRKNETTRIVKLKKHTFMRMEGEVRNLWTHETTSSKNRRISLTFRYVME